MFLVFVCIYKRSLFDNDFIQIYFYFSFFSLYFYNKANRLTVFVLFFIYFVSEC